MCGACGRSVVSDPVLGPVRTMRQHLVVAQTINGVCRSWPGAPKVAATGDGWLVSGPTGATVAVATVEALWSAVLPSSPGAASSDLHRVGDGPGASESSGATARTGGLEEGVLAAGDLAAAQLQPEDLSLRVLNLGHRMAHNAGKALGSQSGSTPGDSLTNV
ncbi:hypothetical protein BJQ90_00018 [Arthrobacter sp. SO3]|nr:hypothetical protein [Arthrobacter sp. SO3]